MYTSVRDNIQFSQRRQNRNNLRRIKRNNKLVEAGNLPTVITLNPRSLYNKKEQFITLVEQMETDVCFVSETWDRSHLPNGLTLENFIQIEGYGWIQNVAQRKCKGGKPALLISTKNYHITKLCPEKITVPVNVEVVWALLTPKRKLQNTRVKHIAVASVYYSSTQTKKDDILDHISEAYHSLCSMYGSDLKFIISGDFNRLNIKPILNLSPDLSQVVQIPTRKNPDATLDLIITNIPALFEAPTTLTPLENDETELGQPSDHLIVVMKPLTNFSPHEAKRYRIIKYRPFPESGIRKMGQWIQSQSWNEIYTLKDPNEKASKFEQLLTTQIEKVFPEKILKINENDKPWVDSKLIEIDRMRKREYSKHKRSEKWKKLNEIFQVRAQKLKENYYENVVEDLKVSNVGKWYSKIKHMSSIDMTKDEFIQVNELHQLPSSDQSELIADKFAEISNQYRPLLRNDIQIPSENESKPAPLFEPYQIHQKIKRMKKKTSTVPGDIDWKIIAEFSVELASPLSNIFNSCTLDGVWPDVWKQEYVTPIPKVFPPNSIDDLRKIAGTKNLSKLYEALLSEYIVKDLESQLDPSQFGNQKGLSITHYLIKMLNKILTLLDTNNQKERYAVISMFIDWSKAFDRQDPKLCIEAFIRNGVRPTLIPILISFYQNRKMRVKWHGQLSSSRDLPGGNPQGCTTGLLGYTSSSNDNANYVDPNMRYKFVDDLSMLELINLLAVGLTSYDFMTHIASDVGVDQTFIPSERLKSQNYLHQVQKWTVDNGSKLNATKSNYIIFNYTEQKFTTRLMLEDQILESVQETKLLGTIITSDLQWHKNTDMLVKKAFQRMIILNKLKSFNVSMEDMLTIYKLYIRSIVEQNCQVWHYSLTEEDQTNLERVQKVACKVILQQDYSDYDEALSKLNLDSLFKRREKLCLTFAKKCVKHPKASAMFPLNPVPMHSTRNPEKFHVQPARTSRLLYSAIPQLQRALNLDSSRKAK